MPAPAITQQRLEAQRIDPPSFGGPADVVRWFGAVQAQDYLGALWAVGLRTADATESSVEQALADKTILRTWPMRGTLHFVAAEDARWMLELLAPRIVARSARRDAELGLDEATFARSRKLFMRLLRDGRQLSRAAMYQALETAKISTAGQRGIHILWRLAHEGLICFGAREGKQRCSKNGRRVRGSCSGAKRSASWRGAISRRTARRRSRISAGGRACRSPKPGRRWSWANQRSRAKRSAGRNAGGGMLAPTIVVDGRVAGTWKRTLGRKQVAIALSPFGSLGKREREALAAPAERFGRFLGKPVAFAG